MARKVVFKTEADLAKIIQFLNLRLAALEVHFSDEYRGISRGLRKLAELLEDYAREHDVKIRITVFLPDGTATAIAVGAGALIGSVIEAAMVGRWFGPWGIVAGGVVGGLAYLVLTTSVDIEIKAFLPGADPGLVPV